MNGMPEGWHEEYLFQPLFDAMRKKDGHPSAIKQREGRQLRATFEYDIRPLEQRIAPPAWDWRRTKRELRKIGLVRKGVRRN